MCLYPKIIKNPKYTVTKKNGGNVPTPRDERQMYIPIGCGQCIECRAKRVRDWWIRIEWENKTNPIRAKGVTFSFSEEALDKLGDKDANEVCSKAIRLFTKRWVKKYGKSLRYWLITELGHENTERVHMHGLVWTEHYEDIENVWGYGNVKVEPMNDKTIPYLTKYALKPDKEHDGFIGKIHCSKGIGKGFEDSETAKRLKRKGVEANEYIKTSKGLKINIPIYYRNKIWNENTRAEKWSKLLDKKKRYVRGLEIDISTPEGWRTYELRLMQEQKYNESLGYPAKPWNLKRYKKARKKLDEYLEN